METCGSEFNNFSYLHQHYCPLKDGTSFGYCTDVLRILGHCLVIQRNPVFSISQTLIMSTLCSDDYDFSKKQTNKSDEMHQFFKTRDYPDSIVNMRRHRAQQVDQL